MRRDSLKPAFPKSAPIAGALLLACALACALAAALPCAAWAAGDGTSSASAGLSAAGSDEEMDLGTLSDRYESLDELANSLNADDNVVVETRIGVLSLVNRALDGATVRFSGEAVGNAVNADDGYKWVQLADAADRPIAVYLSDELADKITSYGSYNSSGTVVEVTGEYHIADPQHQGELDVHATQLEVTDAGGSIAHGVDADRLTAGVALCGVGILLVILFVVLRRRSDRKSEEA